MTDSDRIPNPIPAVRLRRIQEILDRQGSLSLREAQAELAISEMTVRRDFAHLEQLGLVERTWGGVVARRPLMSERAHDERERTEAGAKQAIAALTESLIEQGDTIFLSGGTTALAVARVLAHRSGLTIITTSLSALNVLVGNPDLVVIAVGGLTSPYNNDTTGPQAQSAIRTYRADKAVIGATGITADGVYNANLERAAIDRLMVGHANQTLVVADRTKLGLGALSLVSPLAPTMTLVTDTGLGPRVRDWFDAAGVRVIADREEQRPRRRPPAGSTRARPRAGKASRSPIDPLTKEKAH